MRITNALHFTENHRFTVYRNFALSPMDYRMLASIYQPMVGALGASLFMTLCQQLQADRVGYSSLEQQRALFLTLDLRPGENGRRLFIELTSKLEAVGLLHTVRKFLQEKEDYIFEYQLQQPLAPDEFFRNQHLLLLLRDKIGKHAVLQLGGEMIALMPEELRDANEESLTVPFYEIFQLTTQVIDYELEQAFYEAAPAKSISPETANTAKTVQYEDIIFRFPRSSRNRKYVEGLRFRPDEVASLDYVAQKYNLTLQEICRLLDEDEVFDQEGGLRIDLIQRNANLLFRQENKRTADRTRQLARATEIRSDSGVNHRRTEAEESGSEDDYEHEKHVEMAYYLQVPPLFQGQCDIHQYNTILRNEPYTHVLRRFFTQGRVPDGVLDVFEKIDLHYKLHEEVINVLIHFIHMERRSWAKGSIEYVAADMLGKQVNTYEQAVDYVREQAKVKEKLERKTAQRVAPSGTAGRGRAAADKKPNIPIIGNIPEESPVTKEELEAMRRIARKLDGK